jgi:hypothetical protein
MLDLLDISKQELLFCALRLPFRAVALSRGATALFPAALSVLDRTPDVHLEREYSVASHAFSLSL